MAPQTEACGRGGRRPGCEVAHGRGAIPGARSRACGPASNKRRFPLETRARLEHDARRMVRGREVQARGAWSREHHQAKDKRQFTLIIEFARRAWSRSTPWERRQIIFFVKARISSETPHTRERDPDRLAGGKGGLGCHVVA